MRFEPPVTFKPSEAAAPVGDSSLHERVDTRDLAFLVAYGVRPEFLNAAAARAHREDVCPARALVAGDGISESRLYRGLAHHLGVAFEAGWPRLAAPVDVAEIQRRGFAKLACGRWLIAPCDQALPLLLTARDRFRLNRSRLVLTTPAHLAALARHHAAAALADAASHALPHDAPRLSATGAVDAIRAWPSQPEVTYKSRGGTLHYWQRVEGMYAVPTPDEFRAQLELLARLARINRQADVS